MDTLSESEQIAIGFYLEATGAAPDFHITEQVVRDIRTRADVGLRKYGVTLSRGDLSRRDWLQHAYEEALDMACYLKRLIEMDEAAE